MALPAVTANSPVAGSISWAAFHIQYQGVSYAVAAGSTSSRWTWWRFNNGVPVVEWGPEIPDGQVVNQILNPSFEIPEDTDATLPQSWIRPVSGGLWFNAAHTTALATSQFMKGVQSVALTCGVTGASGPSVMQPVVLNPGDTVRLTFRAKGSNAMASGVYAILVNSAGTAEIVRFTNITNKALTTSWQVFSGTVVVPAGATAGRLLIMLNNRQVGEVMYVDDVEFGVNPPIGLNDDDLVLFGNTNGVPLRVQSTEFIDGDLLIDGSVQVKSLAAEVIMASQVYSNEAYLGQLNADQIETGQLNATLAVVGGGGLTVGDGITLSDEKGVEVVHQAGAPGVEAIVSSIKQSGISLRAKATTDKLEMLDNTVMRGKSNEIATGAEMVIQAGTTPPASGPQISSEYPQHAIHEGYNGRGLVRCPAWGAEIHLMTESFGNAGITMLNRYLTDWAPDGIKAGDYVFGWSNWDLKLDGGRPEATSGLGGITMIGSEAYLLCETTEALPGTYRGRWYVYQMHFNGGTGAPPTKWSYVRRWIYEPHSSLGANSTWRPAIGNDGTNLLIVQAASSNYWIVSRYGPTGTYIGLANLYNDATKTSHATGGRHMNGIAYTAADTGGAACWYIATEPVAYVYCYGTDAVRVTANEFPAPSTPMYGLMWDANLGRFVYRTGPKVYDFSKIKDTDLASNPVAAVQTWRLNNDADTATATVGDFATYETSKSPTVLSKTLQKRSWLRLNSMSPIPDLPSDLNDPDSLTFYVARGGSPVNADFKRIPPYHGTTDKVQTSVLLDTLPTTGLPPPATTLWGAQTAGKIRSVGIDGDGAIWRNEGDGAGRTGPFIWNSAGKLTKGLPCCSVVNTGAQSVPTSTETTMIYNNVEFDTDNMTANYATGFLTIQTAGIYMAYLMTVYASAAGGSRITIFRVNNVNVRRWGYNISELTAETISYMFKAVPGDVVSMRQYQSSGSAMALPGGAYFPGLQLVMVSAG